MSEAKKIAIGLVVMLGVCCCMAGVAAFGLRELGKLGADAVSSDPTRVAEVKEKIADFEIPDGYTATSMSMMVYDLLVMNPDDYQQPIITIAKANRFLTSSPEESARQLREAFERQNSNRGLTMEEVGSFEETIRGQKVTILVREGQDGERVEREWLASFEGRDGPVMLMVNGGVADFWDEEFLKEFIRSLK